MFRRILIFIVALFIPALVMAQAGQVSYPKLPIPTTAINEENSTITCSVNVPTDVEISWQMPAGDDGVVRYDIYLSSVLQDIESLASFSSTTDELLNSPTFIGSSPATNFFVRDLESQTI